MRKIILTVWFAVVAAFGLFGVHVGVEVDPTSVIATLLLIGVWVVREAVRDWAELKRQVQQTNRWGDPAFWTTAIASVVIPLLSLFGVAVSEQIIAIIASLLAIIVPLIVGPVRETASGQ